MPDQDFDLAIASDGDSYLVKILRSPAGEAEAVVQNPFMPHELDWTCVVPRI